MFQNSSHKKRWIFKPSGLEEARIIANIGDSNRVDIDGEQKNDKINHLEELEIVQYYISVIENLCNTFRCNPIVKYTASIYLKRYYLNHNVLCYNPQEIALACLILACKSEEFPYEEVFQRLQALLAKNGHSNERLAELEFEVLWGINFDLKIYLPFSPLKGLVFDLKHTLEKLKVQLPPDEFFAAILQEGGNLLIPVVLKTDSTLLFHPSQLALAALSQAAKNFDRAIYYNCIEKFIHSCQELQNVWEQMKHDGIDQYFTSDSLIIKVASKELLEKRKRLRNPLYVPGTPEFIAAKQELERLKNEKFQIKNEIIEVEENKLRNQLGVQSH